MAEKGCRVCWLRTRGEEEEVLPLARSVSSSTSSIAPPYADTQAVAVAYGCFRRGSGAGGFQGWTQCRLSEKRSSALGWAGQVVVQLAKTLQSVAASLLAQKRVVAHMRIGLLTGCDSLLANRRPEFVATAIHGCDPSRL